MFTDTMANVLSSVRDVTVAVRSIGSAGNHLSSKVSPSSIVLQKPFTDQRSGASLAVGYCDGNMEIRSAENGDVEEDISLQLDPPASPNVPSYSCLGWGANCISHSDEDFSEVLSRTFLPKLTTTDDWIAGADRSRELSKATFEIATSLPQQLANIDIEDMLPKLPVLSASSHFQNQGLSHTFSSRTSMDEIFHNKSAFSKEYLDVLVLAHGEGGIRTVLYQSLCLGLLRLPSSWGLAICGSPCHSSHPFIGSHILLADISSNVKGSGSSQSLTALVPLTLRFIQSSRGYLQKLTSKFAHLHNLLKYTEGCLHAIDSSYIQAHDLPSKFMRNAEETLAEKGEGPLVVSLFHLAVSGDCPPTIKEWLVDQIAERVCISLA